MIGIRFLFDGYLMEGGRQGVAAACHLDRSTDLQRLAAQNLAPP